MLRTAAEVAGSSVQTTLYRGMATLPHFNPDDDREGEPVGYVDADIVEAACTRLPLTRNAVGSDGTISEPEAREKIAEALSVLGQYAADRDPD